MEGKLPEIFALPSVECGVLAKSLILFVLWFSHVQRKNDAPCLAAIKMSEVIPVTGLEYCLVCTKCFLCITCSYCKGHRCCHKKDNYPVCLHTAFILPSRDAIWKQLLHALLVLFLTLWENTRQKKIKEERVDFYSQFEKSHDGKGSMVAEA